MRLTRPVLLLFCATLATAQGNDAKNTYLSDVTRLRSGDTSFDWKAFRLAAKQGGADYFDWHPVRAKFMTQLDAGDTQAALKSANEIMNHNMAEPEGHLLALIAYQKIGNQAEASFQKKVLDAYFKSILDSGNGKSSATAFFVVDESEEYIYLNVIRGVGLPSSQALVSENGHSFDKLTFKNGEGKDEEVWFNVDTSMNSMRDAIEAGSKKK